MQFDILHAHALLAGLPSSPWRWFLTKNRALAKDAWRHMWKEEEDRRPEKWRLSDPLAVLFYVLNRPPWLPYDPNESFEECLNTLSRHCTGLTTRWRRICTELEVSVLKFNEKHGSFQLEAWRRDMSGCLKAIYWSTNCPIVTKLGQNVPSIAFYNICKNEVRFHKWIL